MNTNKSPFMNLPLELVYHILSFVRAEKDLLAVCGTSTKIRCLTLPLCFKTVDLVNHDEDWGTISNDGWTAPEWRDQQNRLVEFLQTPRIALLVTDFRLVSCLSSLFCSLPHKDGSDCVICAATDTIVGDALLAMVNLEVLHFTCRSCTSNMAEPHAYINKLSTKKLRTFCFECLCCCESLVSAQTKRVLSLPALATVENFLYRARINPHPLNLDDPSVLPLVRSLGYHASSLDDWIISNRPTTRWASEADGYVFPSMEGQSLGTPTHLVANMNFPGILRDIPMIFQSLQHVGQFSKYELGYVKEDMIACLPLKNVTSIDVNCNDPSSPWDEGDCVEMGIILPLLRRILVHGSAFAVCELQSGIWKMREVDEYMPWDIICGNCDNL